MIISGKRGRYKAVSKFIQIQYLFYGGTMDRRKKILFLLGYANIFVGVLGLNKFFFGDYKEYVKVLGSGLVFALAVISIFSIVLGFVMMRGLKWGWFVALFFYILTVGQNAILLINILESPSMLVFPVLQMIGVTVISVILMINIMKDDVMSYFDVNVMKKKQYITIASICSVIVIVALYGYVTSQVRVVETFYKILLK